MFLAAMRFLIQFDFILPEIYLNQIMQKIHFVQN